MAVTDKFNEEWNGFKGRLWKEEVNTRQFIQDNYKPYDGDESFLADPTEATNKLWGKLQKLQKEERGIARINAAARMNGLSYSKLMHGLKVANIDINRKMLAELAVNDAEGFAALAEIAKKAFA